MKPVVDRLSKQFSNVEFRRYNVENSQEGQQLAQQVGSQYVPTFLFFDSKGNKVDMVVGGMTEAALKAKIEQLK
jgi:thiol-disulfide isomerase/thioredoxin